ncbi:MAG: tetratricopeptide repeat protein [Parachlamydia sp.]|nr:tetratricopeptide repeat protein [Parachlamydia sp.]
MEPLSRRFGDISTTLPDRKKPSPEQTIASIVTKTKYVEIDKYDLQRLTSAVKKCNRKMLHDISKLNDSQARDSLIRRIEHHSELFKSLPQKTQNSSINKKLTKLHLDIVNPNLTKCWRALGTCYLKDREFDKALRVYSQAIELNPEQADHYYSYAEACIQKGEWDQAREICERGRAFALQHPNASWAKKLTSKMSEKLAQIIDHQKPW